MVYWDQRDAGRSFDTEADPRRLTVARHLADLDAVVDHLRQTLSHEKIILIGHSWGSALGLLYTRDHPDKVSAFIGVSQVVSTRKAQKTEYDFVEAEAVLRGNRKVQARLADIGSPPYQSVEQTQAMEDLCQKYGGVFHDNLCKTCIILRGLLNGPAHSTRARYRCRRPANG